MILLLLATLTSSYAHAATARELTSSVYSSTLRCKEGDAATPYRQKRDFAALEADPLTRLPKSALLELMPGDFVAKSKHFDQECVDRIYAGLPSGPMPDSGLDYEGYAFFPDGGGFQALLGQISPSSGVKAILAKAIEGNLSVLPNTLIQGMRFTQLRGGEHPAFEARSRLDTAAILFLNPSQALKFRSAEEKLFFPAHVYCGQSLLDSRRESIVIDPAYPEDFPDFKPGIDEIPSHKGMNLREEIRMIRPGFYLGRVYGARVYLMSFILYNAKVDQDSRLRHNIDLAHPERNECWLGSQAREK